MRNRQDYYKQSLQNSHTRVQSASYDSFKQAYLNLDVKYRKLLTDYSRLQKQFHHLSKQTVINIQSLDEETSYIIKQKNQQIEALNHILQELKQQNQMMHLERQKMNEESYLLKNQLLLLEKDIRSRDSQFVNDINLSEQNNEQLTKIIMSQTREIDTLKMTIQSQHSKSSHKQAVIHSKQNQIHALSEIKLQLQRKINKQLQFEQQRLYTNESLKQEVQNLRQMFNKMQILIRNCQGCKIRDLKINQHQQQLTVLTTQFLQLKRQCQNQLKSFIAQKQCLSYEINYLKKQIRGDGYNYPKRYNNQNRKPLSYYNGPLLKDSVMKRCKTIMDNNY